MSLGAEKQIKQKNSVKPHVSFTKSCQRRSNHYTRMCQLRIIYSQDFLGQFDAPPASIEALMIYAVNNLSCNREVIWHDELQRGRTSTSVVSLENWEHDENIINLGLILVGFMISAMSAVVVSVNCQLQRTLQINNTIVKKLFICSKMNCHG